MSSRDLDPVSGKLPREAAATAERLSDKQIRVILSPRGTMESHFALVLTNVGNATLGGAEGKGSRAASMVLTRPCLRLSYVGALPQWDPRRGGEETAAEVDFHVSTSTLRSCFVLEAHGSLMLGEYWVSSLA